MDINSGVPQGSLLVPLLFCIFVNGLPVVVNFGDPFLFADDFKLLAHIKLESEIQSDLEQVARSVKENKMDLAPNKCFRLARGPLESINSVTDLGVIVYIPLTWSEHLEN